MTTRPSALRMRWPLIVLLASIGLTALAAFDTQRAVRGNKAIVDRAIKEFSSFAAWSYSEHLKQKLSVAAVEVVGAVNHGGNMHTNPRVPTAEELVHYLPGDMTCDCHRTHAGPIPDYFFAFKIGTKDVDIAHNHYSVPSEGWQGDPRDAISGPHAELRSVEPESRWIADTLTYQARNVPRDEHGYGILIAQHDGRSVPITYTLMPTAWGDTMVYGAEYNATSFGKMLGVVLDDKGLLPTTFTKGARNRDVLALRILDGANETRFESHRGVNSRTFTELALPPEYGSMKMRVMMRPDQAANVIIGGLPRSRLPFLLGLLALAAMMSVIAVVQIRRETEFAGMRADFVSSISHELRTPLAQIKLYLETLRTGRASTPEQREWSLRHIDRETTRLGNLVENVLRFARLGRADSSASEAIDLADESEHIVDEFRPLAASRKATIELNVTDRPLVRLRPEAVRHALVNLLDNAVKYGPVSQTIRVDVALNNGNAVASVSDEGAGVRPEDRESIWRAFARAKSATGAAGSGIGLTIVRDVMRQNGGDAWVEDAAPHGARFVLSMPACGRAEVEIDEPTEIAAATAG